MTLTGIGTVFLAPQARSPEKNLVGDLAVIIPDSFGGWRLQGNDIPAIVPEGQAGAAGSEIYSQVLNRTYVNDKGEIILLTVAWGNDQRDSLRIHNPEVCYGVQGFSVSDFHNDVINLADNHTLEVRRLFAERGLRSEPVTYWIVVGDRVVNDRFQRKLEQLRYGLEGVVPDGVLVRVSSIERDEARAYARHDSFISAMSRHLSGSASEWLLGEGVVQ